MLRRCLAVSLRTAGILALSGSLASAFAVELGEVVVRSHIGQPLVADIELTGYTEGAPLDARLAHPDVFKGANLAMHPVLPTMRMAVTRRDRGGQFLRITSVAPVQTQYVHLFLDLGEGGRRNVRQASLPLTPDPRPAPPAAPAPVAAPPKVADSTAAPVLAAPAPAPKLAAPVARPVVKPPIAAAPAAAPAASCPKPRYSDEEVRACATRDYKNAILSAQIVELEEKVRALQAALDAPAPGGAPALPTAAAKPAQPAPPPMRTAPPRKDMPAPAQDDGLPWIWIGAGLAALAAVAAAALVVLKRRKRVNAAAPARPKSNMLGRLRDALNRDKRPGRRIEPGEDAP